MRKPFTLALALVLATSVRGQDPLESHRKAVAKAWASVQAAVAAAREDSIRGYSVPAIRSYSGLAFHADTTMLPSDFMRTMDAAFADALKDAVVMYGSRAHGIMTGMGVAVTRGALSESAMDRMQSRFATLRSDPIGKRTYAYQTIETDPPNREVLAQQFRYWFAEAATASMPASMRQWIGTTMVSRKYEEFYGTFRALARDNTRASRSCLQGSLDACARLMGIQPHNDTVAKWLEPEERLAALRGLERGARTRLNLRLRYLHTEDALATFDDCLQRQNMASCDYIFGILHWGPPLAGFTREYLLQSAVTRGGDDAFARLENAKATDIGEILSITAGVPVDTLIAEWRSRVMAAQPVSPAPKPKELLGCAILGLGMLAAGTRRRV